ncbi:MAG: two-component system response regulator [Burkholderiales bacterium]|nr:two-component system response regulator [Burkholderiales bacterium]MDE1929580.1 two-component system response regulator [Burkholderiales bacterium]MDE2160682.1 two-component system response regulator [Burkholderiales bacterium]MDE2502389.1 two-component system response regulator [Burkholderiales bacterium]
MNQQTILIVDDNPENLTVLGELLVSRYTVRAANSGLRALQLARQAPLPDLILLDVMMPNMNGYEVLEQLRAAPETSEIPVIFITAMNSAGEEEHGLAAGAVDYITKPLSPAVALARVRTHLELRQARVRLQDINAGLEAEVAARMRENLSIQDVTIRALARLAETRDNETGNHILRTQQYVGALARRVAQHPRFAAELDEQTIALMAKSAPLHDIGKVGIPDQVLLKPGKLTPEEWAVMKTHAQLGADAIERAEADAQTPVKFLLYAKQVALRHHERWDGSGYPGGLAGEAIPLAARLMALADVFDALISRRVYKAPLPLAETRRIMAAERGRHFDPDLLDAFLEGFDEFADIAARYPDHEPEAAAHGA